MNTAITVGSVAAVVYGVVLLMLCTVLADAITDGVSDAVNASDIGVKLISPLTRDEERVLYMGIAGVVCLIWPIVLVAAFTIQMIRLAMIVTKIVRRK